MKHFWSHRNKLCSCGCAKRIYLGKMGFVCTKHLEELVKEHGFKLVKE